MHLTSPNYAAPARTAIFVDLENVYYFLKRRLKAGEDAVSAMFETLRELKGAVKEKYGHDAIILFAYGDFERLPDTVQNQLYLLGFDTRNVLGTEHKNAADMQLCIDAMHTLYVRADIAHFVIVAGDRDYIPVIKHVVSQGREVLVSAFKDATSGDLLEILGADRFFDLTELVTQRFKLMSREEIAAQEAKETRVNPARPQTPGHGKDKLAATAPATKFPDARPVHDADAKIALSTMMRYFGDKPEVWMSPFLHKLREELPELAEYERKSLISTLKASGAIVVESRPGWKDGEAVDYSVAIINWDHPQVRELNQWDGQF